MKNFLYNKDTRSFLIYICNMTAKITARAILLAHFFIFFNIDRASTRVFERKKIHFDRKVENDSRLNIGIHLLVYSITYELLKFINP